LSVSIKRKLHHIEIGITSGYLVISPSRTVYVTVPKKIVDKLREDHNINLQNKKDEPNIFCELATDQNRVCKLIFTVENNPYPKEEVVNEMRLEH